MLCGYTGSDGALDPLAYLSQGWFLFSFPRGVGDNASPCRGSPIEEGKGRGKEATKMQASKNQFSARTLARTPRVE